MERIPIKIGLVLAVLWFNLAIADRGRESEQENGRCPPLYFTRSGDPMGKEMYLYAVPDSEANEGNQDYVVPFHSKYAQLDNGCKFGLNELCIMQGSELSSPCLGALKCMDLNPNKPTPSFEAVEGSSSQSNKLIRPVVGICGCPLGMRENLNRTECVKAVKFGAKCSAILPCEGEVDCFQNRCSCPPIKSFNQLAINENTNYTYGVPNGKPYNGNRNELQEHPRFYNELQKRCDSGPGGVCSYILPDWDVNCPKDESCFTGFPSTSGLEDYDPEAGYYSDDTKRYPILGRCDCSDNLVRDPNTRMCKPRPTIGESCLEENECLGHDVKCKSGRCACAGDDTTYEPEWTRCVVIPGGKCSSWKYNCGQHAECKYSNSQNSQRCTCKDGYELINGSCIAGHMGQCKKSKECNSQAFLKCVDTVCKCGDSANQVYNELRKECEGIVGSKCLRDGSGKPCTELAQCIDGVCKCGLNSVETPDRMCERMGSLEQECSVYPCNYRKGLACIDGKCKCFDSQYEAKNGVCVGKIGSYCGKVEHVGWSSGSNGGGKKYYFIECEEGSSCHEIPDGKPRCKV